MYKISFIALFLLTALQLSTRIGLGNENKPKNITLKEAIELGRDELKKINNEIWSKPLTIIADNDNSAWTNCVTTQFLNDHRITEMVSTKRPYWAIYYSTSPKELEPRSIWSGPSAFVFVDRVTGAIIDMLYWPH